MTRFAQVRLHDRNQCQAGDAAFEQSSRGDIPTWRQIRFQRLPRARGRSASGRSCAKEQPIVPPPMKKPERVVYDTILCPIDYSDESTQALDYGLSLAQESGARIILLHVLGGFLDDVDPQQIRNVNVRDFLRYSEQDASSRLSAAVPEEARVWSHPIERLPEVGPTAASWTLPNSSVPN